MRSRSPRARRWGRRSGDGRAQPEDDGGDVFGVAQLAQGDGHARRQQGRDQTNGDPFDGHGMIACAWPHDDDHADEAHGDGGPAAGDIAGVRAEAAIEIVGAGGGGVGKRQQPAFWPRAKIVDDGINRLAPSQGGQGGGCGYEG
mgnify:CR=1 FL=1